MSMRMTYYGHTRKDYKKRARKKRDWRRSEFNNPYFSKPHSVNLKSYLYLLSAIVVILTLIYLFLFSNYWKINSVSVKTDNEIYREKVKDIINDNLNSTMFNILNGANYFIFNVEDVEKKISNQLLVKNVKVRKKMPNKIIVNFSDIKPFYIWIQNNRYYNISEENMVLNEIISLQRVADSIEPIDNIDNKVEKQKFNIDEIKKFLQHSTANLDLPIIYNKDNKDNAKLNTRDFISNKKIFQLINDLNSKLKRQIGVKVILYKIDAKNFKKIEVVTENGWNIYIATEKDLDEQLENLYSLMRTTFKTARPTEYIDLRYGNKIYYK